jgi:hypothetical protein
MMFDHVDIKISEIGPDSGVIGAASLCAIPDIPGYFIKTIMAKHVYTFIVK